MLIAIDGQNFITEIMAFELITDFIKPFDSVEFVFARTESDPDGLKNAYDAVMELCDLGLATVPFLWDGFDQFIRRDGEKVFLVLGTEGQEDNISKCHAHGIPVYDLSRALFPVT